MKSLGSLESGAQVPIFRCSLDQASRRMFSGSRRRFPDGSDHGTQTGPPSDHWPLIVHCSVLSALLLPPLPIRFTWCPHSNSGCCCGLWHRTKPHPFAVSLRILTCYFHSLQISPNPQEYSWSTALD